MSHHLTSDEAYLAALAESAIPYIGLLGPAPRRARLMNDIGERSTLFGSRLYGPIGLDIGAKTPGDHRTRHRRGNPGGARGSSGLLVQCTGSRLVR